MKFSHLADCHIGCWRDSRLRELSLKAFENAMDLSVEKSVDFILIAGDFFDTSNPPLDVLERCVLKLKEIKDRNLPVYIIPGSHDFSPSGRTIINVLENAGLVKNAGLEADENNKPIIKFTVDPATNVKIIGLAGKKSSIDREHYEAMDKAKLEEEEGIKIFMFHIGVLEMLPDYLKEINAISISSLPEGFEYYAGGHIHEKMLKKKDGGGIIAYPCSTFPTEFKELESGTGGFYIVSIENGATDAEWIPTVGTGIVKKGFLADGKSPEMVDKELTEWVGCTDVSGKVVLIRVEGALETGRVGEIDFRKITDLLNKKGAYAVLKNISKLRIKEYGEIEPRQHYDKIDEMEKSIIEKQQAGKLEADGFDKELMVKLMDSADTYKQEGETTADFEKRVLNDLAKILGISIERS